MNNRQARRRAQREQQNPKTILPHRDKVIQKYCEEEVEAYTNAIKGEAIMTTFNVTLAATVISLHDQFGFGLKRLQRLVDTLQDNFESITAGTVSPQDMIQWCEEYGVVFDGNQEEAENK